MTDKQQHTPRYVVARSYIVTANEDRSVPLNSRVLASVGKDDDQAECQEMLHRANTQPELLRALEKIELWSRDHGNGTCEAINDKARAAIAKATIAKARGE